MLWPSKSSSAAPPPLASPPSCSAASIRHDGCALRLRLWLRTAVCVFSLAPGNGDAFTSFILGDPAGRVERLGPECADWPAGREPLFFTDSEYAYVGLVANIGNVLGVWLFKRYLRTAPWRPLFAVTIVVRALPSIAGTASAAGAPLSPSPCPVLPN